MIKASSIRTSGIQDGNNPIRYLHNVTSIKAATTSPVAIRKAERSLFRLVPRGLSRIKSSFFILISPIQKRKEHFHGLLF
jgi:hypothetical protein